MSQPANNKRRSLLFLCSGNVLRSAFCELYAKHLELPFQISSGATQYRNHAIFPESRAALQELGVPGELLTTFKPRHVEDFTEALTPNTLVFGMTHAHLTAFTETFGDGHDTRLMLSVLGQGGEVDDPYFTERYDETFETLTACIEALRDSPSV